MKKILILVLTLLVLGGAGYFIFGKSQKAEEASAASITEAETKTVETLNTEEATEVQTDIPLDKVWEYEFEPALDESSLTDETIYIVDEDEKNIKISYELADDGGSLLIHPPSGGYKKGTRYELHITDALKKVTGENVSHSYEMDFITIRDEVEKGKLKSAIKQLKEDQFEIIGENILEIDKEVKIKKDDIIIIPTVDYPDGQALKITKTESDMGSYTVHVKEPEFDEIYEDLDLNKTYPITEDNIILEDNATGVTIESLASGTSSTMVASATAGKKEKVEFKHAKPKINVDLKNGIQVKFSDFPINPSSKKNKLGIDGTIKMFSPEIHADISPLGILHRFKLVGTGKMTSDVKVKAIGKIIDEDVPIRTARKIARIEIPTPIPGLLIEGNLMIRFDYTFEGGLETMLYLDYEDVSGFVYEHKEADPIYKLKEAEFDLGIQGRGKAEGRIGPAADIQLTGFGVLGGGLEAFAGAKASAEAIAGENAEFGKYACAKSEEKLFIQGSVILNAFGDTFAEWVFGEADFGKEQSNSCKYTDSLAPIKQQELTAGEEEEVQLEVIEHDLLAQESKSVQANMKGVKISSSTKGVVEAEKTKKGISIKALDLPEKEKTTITVTKKIDGKEESIDFPVNISNYKEITEAKKKEIAEFGWNGEWKRVINANTGTLTISNYDGSNFDLAMDVLSGSHTASIDGKAVVTGKTATFNDEEYNCRLDFTLGENSVGVEETQACTQIGGIGTYFSGDYLDSEAAASTPATTLSSLMILDEESDGDIQRLLGNDYAGFVDNMQLVSETRDKYGLAETVVLEGAVRGMYTLMEGIIVEDPFNNYYIGNLVSDSEGNTTLRFYTNDANYKNKLHDVVDTWRQDFSTYPVEYVYKKL
jgi:hypothetical protein